MHGRTAGPIKQTFVGEVSYNPYVETAWARIKIGKVTIKISDVEDEIVVSGHDKKDRPWNVFVTTAGGVGGSWAWTADLDGDGTKDLIFIHQYSHNGRCVSQSILRTILFDNEGRPSPWELEGYFNYDYGWKNRLARGVLDLGDWRNNGRAQLVTTACYGYEYQELSYEPYV
jgi:hypothetical protein